MEEKIIKYLADLIIKNLKDDFYFRDIENILNNFLENNTININDKEHVIELLYLYKVYKNGYVSLDPRYIEKMKYQVFSVLKSKNSNELNEKIQQLEDVVEMLKDAENNPIKSAQKRIEDQEKYGNAIF